jgi:hypothetical protein
MSVEQAYEVAWARGKALDTDALTCVVAFERANDERLAAEFATHLERLGGFEIPAVRGRLFVVSLVCAE